jgi:hypothetical protein
MAFVKPAPFAMYNSTKLRQSAGSYTILHAPTDRFGCFMPNWVEQDLHIVGAKPSVDQFIRNGFKRRRRGELDDVLDFTRLCPLKRGARKVYTHPTGVVLTYFRTRTQANFSMITSWAYPAEFYARLPKYWPSLSFVCAVNEDMGQFGGIIMVLDGEVINLVRDYDASYSKRAHSQVIRAVLKRWGLFLVEGRPWRVVPNAARKHGSMPFDAHFDGDFWFYFRTRKEVAQFRERYKSKWVLRRTADGWRRARSR